MQGLEIDGLIVRRALLPAPIEDANPFECQGPYGGLMGFTLGAFHRALGWSRDEIEAYLVNVRRAIQDRSVHGYHKT